MYATAQTFTILCPVPALVSLATDRLERQGLQFDPAATVMIVLDTPRGFALEALRSLAPARRQLIVVSWSLCPEYLEDLWDLRPQILLAGEDAPLDLAAPVAQAARGARYRATPGLATTLLPVERRVLQAVARGQSNQEIAAQLSLQLQTVKNIVAVIYQKLGIKNRSAALLYYWDIWSSPADAFVPASERYLGG